MRRSICQSEPSAVLAGEVGTWKFSYTTSTNLPKGTLLHFDPLVQGRDIDWELPQESSRAKNNLIWLQMPKGKPLFFEKIEKKQGIGSVFTINLPSELKAGETLNIFLGSPENSKKEQNGNRAQAYTQRRRPFYLYIDPKGKKEFKDPEVFTVDIRGNALHQIKIQQPSLVIKNKRFDVLLRFEDEFGNLTNHAPENTLIELSYEHLRENLSWKLFVPETGFINLPNLYFNEEGTYRIRLRNLLTEKDHFSSPIRCLPDGDLGLYWGTFHGESEKVDSDESVETCLRHFRDECGYQFFGTSSFESEEETSTDIWKGIMAHVADLNEESRFTTFLGMQWQGEKKKEGLRQLIYLKDSKPILRKKESKNNTLKKILRSHNPKEILSIPSYTMYKETSFDFEELNPEYEPVVEIYNSWGSSECLSKEGNLKPILKEKSKTSIEAPEGSIRKALNSNHRFGFVAGGLDDRGTFNSFFESDLAQYTPGLTAIITSEQTRDGLFQALHRRSCYATTGARIVVGFNIAGFPMGSFVTTAQKPGLLYNRHITGYVAGTTEIEKVEIIRSGSVFHTIKPESPNLEIAFDDSELFDKAALSVKGVRFLYYYIRVIQKDGHVAWSSPIWVDWGDPKTVVVPKKGKK